MVTFPATPLATNVELCQPIYKCDVCVYETIAKYNYNRHLVSARHLKKSSPITPIVRHSNTVNSEYRCPACNYTAINNRGWNKHVRTVKHCQMMMDCAKAAMGSDTQVTNHPISTKSNVSENPNPQYINRDEIVNVIEEYMETVPKSAPPAPSVTTTNNKISINVFLNSVCKDAIPFTEFMNELQSGISINELDYSVEHGLETGIQNMIENSVSRAGIDKRPFHCVDVKRKKFMIRDEEKWKHDVENKIMQWGIGNVKEFHYNTCLQWAAMNPRHMTNNTAEHDLFLNYIKTCSQRMDEKAMNRILGNVAKQVSCNATQIALLEDDDE